MSYTITADEGVLAEACAGVYKIGGGDLGQFARVLDQALLSMKLKEDLSYASRASKRRKSMVKRAGVDLESRKIDGKCGK